MNEIENFQQRDHWGGRGAFVLAAIGSAVGLGNLWAFPYKLYAGGGGAFLIPYFIAIFLIGLPLLIMEYSVGHWAQNSPPGAFARILGKYRFVGWWLTAVAFVIITYYTIILGYSLVMLWDSLHAVFSKSFMLPWAGGINEAKSAFFGNMLDYEETFAVAAPEMSVLLGMIASWGLIYICLFRGVKWVSKVVLITVPLPWIMLMILTVRGLTLEGAMTGLHYYLEPDWSKLLIADTWRLAFAQVFFSLSLGFAVMLCYASFLHKKSDINNNAAIVALGDLGTSFVAGIAVFSVMGNMAMLLDKPVESAITSGPGLAFAVYPYALSQLPAGAAIFSVIFFAALLTLGIDSAFSIVEAVQSGINDNRKKSWRKSWTLPAICTIGALGGILFSCGKGGLNWLGLVDDLVNGPYGILTVAFAETVVVGWAWKGQFVKKMRAHANERSDWHVGVIWDVIIKYIAPGFLLVLIAWTLSDFIAGKPGTDAGDFATQNWWFHLIGHLIFASIPFVFLVFADKKNVGGDEEEGGRKSGAVWPILTWPGIATVIGVIWGFVRKYASGPSSAKIVEQSKQLFCAVDIGITSYIVLTVAFTSIFGGLIWCFWRAMIAAGQSDTELPNDA